jgi:hypothetical protein
MSLHHPSLVHGSPTNRAAKRRIGVAIRYVRPSARWGAGPREQAMLVRGVDAAGSFDALPRPERDGAPEALARHAELMRPIAPRRVVHVGLERWARPVALRGTLRDGRGVLLCGPPGCRKSALAAALAQHEWTPLVSESDASGNGVEAHHASRGTASRTDAARPAASVSPGSYVSSVSSPRTSSNGRCSMAASPSAQSGGVVRTRVTATGQP